MKFENFFEEADKRDFHIRLIAVGAVFLLVIGFWIFGLLVSKIHEPVHLPEQPARVLTKEERRRQVEEFCANLPKPEKFHFMYKSQTKENGDLTYVEYFYESERDWEEIIPAFTVWFSANGWKPTPNVETIFSKGNKMININKDEHFPRNYRIYCTEGF